MRWQSIISLFLYLIQNLNQGKIKLKQIKKPSMILSVKGTSLTRYFTLVNFILNLSLGSLCFWFLEGDVILNILFYFVDKSFKNVWIWSQVALVLGPHPVYCVINEPGVFTFLLVKPRAYICTQKFKDKNIFLQ